MTFPDWKGALVNWLSHSSGLLDPATGSAPKVQHERPAGKVPTRPEPILVVASEPGFAHVYVPLARPRVALYAYHSTAVNAVALMNAALDVLGPFRHGGSSLTIELSGSLGSGRVRFNGFVMAATPISLIDEGWHMSYCPLEANLHAEVLT